MPDIPPFIQENVPLAQLTTMKVGGPARYFAVFQTDDELRTLLSWAHAQSLPSICLGGGSNVIIADAGFPGLVIHPADESIQWHGGTCVVGSGRALGSWIAEAADRGFGGLELLVGVPGHIGGSVLGNAGGRSIWLSSYIDWVETMTPDGNVSRYLVKECQFGYRTSRFKSSGEILLRVAFTLPPTPIDQAKADIRQAALTKQQHQPLGTATAGCMFKNLAGSEATNARLKSFQNDDGSIPAWKLIAEVELAGYRLGGMQISDQHANFMINTGQGTADQAVQLMSLVKQRVRDTLGVQLHDEIKLIGF